MEDRTYSGIKLLPRVQEGTDFYLVASQHLSLPPRSIYFTGPHLVLSCLTYRTPLALIFLQGCLLPLIWLRMESSQEYHSESGAQTRVSHSGDHLNYHLIISYFYMITTSHLKKLIQLSCMSISGITSSLWTYVSL